MIPFTTTLNLGADKTRMKNRSDVERQEETCRVLLRRLYDDKEPDFAEIQLLADEVGMGKTFVALAVAYSVLEAQRRDKALPDCLKKILVLVPRNDELMRKWHREAGEIIKRCVPLERRSEAQQAFGSIVAEKPDELVAALRNPQIPIVVAKTSALGARIRHEDPKCRLTLATLFRCWGNALPIESRRLLLKGARKWGWPAEPTELGNLSDEDEERLPMLRKRIVKGIRLAVEDPHLGGVAESLLARCKELGAPYARDREQAFGKLHADLVRFYKHSLWLILARDLPLVIVDEAHQWKNKANDFPNFSRLVAPRARRALLLTATPFQLAPSELLSLLEVSDHLGLPDSRREALKHVREDVIRPALSHAEIESRRFSSKWAGLGDRLDVEALTRAWESPPVIAVKGQLAAMAKEPGALDEARVDAAIHRVRQEIEPQQREFLCQALRLYAFNRDLGDELGKLVIRHRRPTQHRLVRAGQEIDHGREALVARPDAHVLHHAPGLDVRGDDELPLYLLMRATSELEQGKRSANLGSSLTGCYSTFFHSAASKAFARVDRDGKAAPYVDLLKELVGDPSADDNHPKMRRVVREVVERWERGEKSLVFTFRVNTADRLHALVQREVDRRLAQRRQDALGGEGGVKQLRQSLSSKTRPLMPILLDRVLWSLLWAPPGEEVVPFYSTDLRPQQEDYATIARLALRFGVDVLDRQPDRVFLHRAAEYALASRLKGLAARGSRVRLVLDKMASESWVERLYGGAEPGEEEASAELTDERGVQSVYEPQSKPRPAEIEQLAASLLDRDKAASRSGQVAVVRQAFVGPSFWLGTDPETELLAREHHQADVEVDRSDQRFLHVHLRELTWNAENGSLDFRTRALAFKALRRAMLRESILVRLLPRHEEREDEAWSTLLVKHFTERVGDQAESMLRRVAVFVEDLAASSGSIDDPRSARGALYESTKNLDTVGIVKGDTDKETRSRRFQGFNTPLLPEILICGQIAQEGIDLHRHCSHVVHYDLAWNPATLEQRTGRIDRIGSRTQRLRQLTGEFPSSAATVEENGASHRLDVDTPYLAGTYDERMFEELRLRAQTFEVLLGGDLASSQAEGGGANGADSLEEQEGEPQADGLAVLPAELTDSLRVDLSVWRAAPTASSGE